MKRVSVFVLFLIVAAMFNACQKSEFIDTTGSQAGILKNGAICDLPIFMDQEIQIGCATITHDPATNKITVAADLNLLDPKWEVTDAHLYAGPTPPPTSAPGSFPFTIMEAPVIFEIDGPADICTDFNWYYALHIAFEWNTGVLDDLGAPIYEYETAWVLPLEGGTNWKNKGKGNNTGWGEYFQWEFNYVPEISDITLVSDPGALSGEEWLPSGVWTGVPEYPEFEMCLMANNPFYFFDVEAMDVSVPLEEGVMNEFFIDEVADDAFWEYWNLKGVNETATPGTWQALMWLILNGDAPMFYLVWDGTQYDLIDGLQYAEDGDENPLRISGDYPADIYTFTGSIAGEYCTLEDFSISLTVGPCPAP